MDAIPAPRSRGLLVSDFVHGAVPARTHAVELLPVAPGYGPFNLLAWDGATLVFSTNHPHAGTHVVAPGVHAMSNGAFDAPWPKSGHATRALAAWLASAPAEGDAPPLARLFDALADTTPAPDQALPDTGIGLERERALSPPFVRDPRYGTRCSTIVLAEAGSIAFHERRFDRSAQLSGESAVRLARC
jgi:uncharacterized protein with NRDE domain